MVPDIETKGLTHARQALYCCSIIPGKSISFKLLNLVSFFHSGELLEHGIHL